jgi:hypothetical protein
MMTIIGTLLGFLGAAFPEIMKMYRDRADKSHELAIMDRQLQMQREGREERLGAIDRQAAGLEMQALYKTFYSGVSWVDGLNATVRPVLAYAFFALYAYIKVNQAIHTPWKLWDEEDQAIFASIMSFYFGHRAMRHFRKQ